MQYHFVKIQDLKIFVIKSFCDYFSYLQIKFKKIDASLMHATMIALLESSFRCCEAFVNHKLLLT